MLAMDCQRPPSAGARNSDECFLHPDHRQAVERSAAGQTVLPAAELSKVPEGCRPRALGAVPRLGLGSRTTILGWPVIFRFLSCNGLYANAIQNSVARELMPLAALSASSARESAYLPGLGAVEIGHTGSTIEGLLHWGMRSAARAGYDGPGFGADADHLPTRQPGSEQWQSTLRLIHCSRGYSHFTLDVGALIDWKKKPIARIEGVPPAVKQAVGEISDARAGKLFDLEISLDESPEGVPPEAAATAAEEIAWLLGALAGEGVSPQYVAPHLGFTKGSDVEDLQRLGSSVGKLFRTAGERGVLLSVHSGDYLGSATRRVLGEACGGRLLFKVSPALQDLFADAVLSGDPQLAKRWSQWTLGYAKDHGVLFQPADELRIFRKFSFAAFGARGEAGDFPMRKMLYGASASVTTEFEQKLKQYLQRLAEDLSMSRKE